MWTFFEDGTMYSTVRSDRDPAVLVVRTRDPRSAQRFASFAGKGSDGVVQLPGRDYGWRVFTDEDTWTRFLEHKARSMRATNFKSMVGSNLGYGHPWLSVLHDVWSVLFTYQRQYASRVRKVRS